MKKFEILSKGDGAILKINAQEGEIYQTEGGAMVAMSPTFQMKSTGGSLGKMLGRSLSGESAFMQYYKATTPGELLLAPKFNGDIHGLKIEEGRVIRISNGNFLACTQGVNIDIKARTKGMMGSGEGLLSLTASGEGALFVSSCGSVYKKSLLAGEKYVVDSNHLVMWDDSLELSTELAGGIANSILSGEGLVAKFIGPGEVWIQTRGYRSK